MSQKFIKRTKNIKVSFLLALALMIGFASFLSACAPRVGPGKNNQPDLVSPLDTPSAEAYREKGMIAFKKGSFESAIENWSRAEELYSQKGETQDQCRVMVELSRAYQTIGLNNNALDVLEKALARAEELKNPAIQAEVLNHLGNLHTLSGDGDQAEHDLNRSLLIAGNLDDPQLTASILNNQGNLNLFKNKYQDAVQAYWESIRLSKAGTHPLLTITAQINCARVYLENNETDKVNPLLDDTLKRLNQLEDSNFKAHGLINTGLAFQDLGKRLKSENEFLLLSHHIFSQAHEVGLGINDHRVMSYALGYTGKLYEDEHRYEEARQITQRAAFEAQKVYAPESLYKWQWQTGRILKQMNNVEEAVAAYRRTIFTLQSIRQEIDNCYDIRQASFRKIAGEICFEMVDLLLMQSKTVKHPDDRQTLLLEARDVVELLRVYELRNYFKDDCVDAGQYRTVSLDSISRTATVIYPILLEDRMEVLLSLPSGLKQISVPVDKVSITRQIRLLRKKLEKRTTWEFLPHARILYDYLIRPIEADLSRFNTDTLVFVPSGPLRTIPMGVLQDGKEFLVKKYAIAVTPGLNLIDPTPVERKNLKVLAAGITKASQGFPPLPEVAAELGEITSLFPGKLLLDQDFSITNIETELKDETFTIVHIASHGQYRTSADQTFILAFDDKLTMNTLDRYAGFLQFRNTPLDLLALSACESAAGDDLAALGMAGVAVKAGAKSALATLWFINDKAASLLIKQFYLKMNDPRVSRARALQQAQLSLLKDERFAHPGYWSPFLLINNWL